MKKSFVALAALTLLAAGVAQADTLGKIKETLDPRSVTIATYALCGFANFASIAIQIGGIGALAPTRRAELAKFGLRAMVGGLLACYMMATIAGLLTN